MQTISLKNFPVHEFFVTASNGELGFKKPKLEHNIEQLLLFLKTPQIQSGEQ